MTHVEMCSEIDRLVRLNLLKLFPNIYQNIDDIPTDINDVHDIYKIDARHLATMSVNYALSLVCVVKALESEETIDTTMLREPFRAGTNSQQHILYKWICLCSTSLDLGFCAHVFFVEHHDHNNSDTATPILESVLGRSSLEKQLLITDQYSPFQATHNRIW